MYITNKSSKKKIGKNQRAAKPIDRQKKTESEKYNFFLTTVKLLQ